MRFEHNFCPVCGKALKVEERGGRERPVCACGYVHYANPAPAAGAVVMRDGLCLWVRRAGEPRKDLWSLPSGFLEWDEDIRDCARRETLEETGLEVEIGEILETLSGFDDPRTQAVLTVFFARVVGGVEQAGDDASETRWFPVLEPPKDIAWQAHRHIAKRLVELAKSGEPPA
ncbi:NUDIX hydrolase [bacterium]|nr:NUDIX hydrolase [bacterium]